MRGREGGGGKREENDCVCVCMECERDTSEWRMKKGTNSNRNVSCIDDLVTNMSFIQLMCDGREKR